MQAIAIPKTTPQHYISFKHALNLRLPDEDTGDWHFRPMFFEEGEPRRAALIAGESGRVNTNPALGQKGIREMSQILEQQNVLPAQGPVYVADHYRAIADLAMLQLSQGKVPTIATNREINAWLDTEEQVNHLITEYLIPLRSQRDDDALAAYDQWITTIHYD